MDERATRTLFFPFETGMLPLPGAGSRALFLDADPGFRPPEGFDTSIEAVQGFRPDFLALQRRGVTVTPAPEGDGYDFALVLLGRHRGASEANLAEALVRVKPGGLVVAAGTKNDGAASFAKRLARTVPGLEHAAKHHGTVLWFVRPDDKDLARYLPRPEAPPLVEGRFHAAPGMFSHDRVDAGSAMLVEHLPAGLSGHVADFCAGWGYLSAMVAAKCPGVTAIDLYEADFASLEAARKNLDDVSVPVRFFWHDLAGEPVGERYDVIVMNPPFHAGRKAEPELGQAMIARAAGALKTGGCLYMVANRQLPYEQALERTFRRHRQVAENNGFKVMEAVR